MQLFCSNCEVAFTGQTHCPKCAARLIAPQEAFVTAETATAPPPDPIRPTFLSRIILGSIATVGLLVAFRELTSAIMGGTPPDAGIVLGLRFLAIFGGGLLCGAGRTHTAGPGLFVGIAFALLLIANDFNDSSEPNAIWFAILSLGFPMIASVAAWIGSNVWPSAPELLDALPNPNLRSSNLALLSGLKTTNPRDSIPPTAWLRVVVGSLIAFAGIAASDEIRNLMFRVSSGAFQTGGLSRGGIVGVQIAGILLFLGGAVAGATTGSGLRHGILTGVLASLDLFVASVGRGEQSYPALEGFYRILGISTAPLNDWQNGLPVAIAILVFTSFGGWLGGQFFLKLAPQIMRNRRLIAQT